MKEIGPRNWKYIYYLLQWIGSRALLLIYCLQSVSYHQDAGPNGCISFIKIVLGMYLLFNIHWFVRVVLEKTTVNQLTVEYDNGFQREIISNITLYLHPYDSIPSSLICSLCCTFIFTMSFAHIRMCISNASAFQTLWWQHTKSYDKLCTHLRNTTYNIYVMYCQMNVLCKFADILCISCFPWRI